VASATNNPFPDRHLDHEEKRTKAVIIPLTWTGEAHIDRERINRFLKRARLPLLQDDAEVITWNLIRAHVTASMGHNVMPPAISRPFHGEPPHEKDRLKTLLFRWLFY